MCKQVKIWIDEKGKQWETIQEPCPRCGGLGIIIKAVINGSCVPVQPDNGVCWKCLGEKYIYKDRRVLTEKEKQQRERARVRKEEKLQLEKQQQEDQKEDKLNTFLNENPKTYIVIDEDSYNKKDVIKSSGYKWLTWNWAGFKPVEGIKTLEVNTIDVLNTYTIKIDEEKVNDEVKEYLNKIKEEENAVLKYVGAIGDKIEVELTCTHIIGYDTQYGRSYISLFKDHDGNIYKWNSKNLLEIEDNEYKKVKATIKSHEEYQGEKQTVITRCKIV